jgi:hypothetical protein
MRWNTYYIEQAGKDLVDNSRGLLEDTVSEFVWWNEGKSGKMIGIAGAPDGIRT